jgi:peptidoglycan/LPS O-acetylase OafA/YrhL
MRQPERLSANKRPDLGALTGVRFIAASCILLFHSKFDSVLTASGLRSLANVVNNCDVAVQLFFVLSGFILAYTYHDKMDRKGAVRAFSEARFARIWPLYFLSLLLSSVIRHTTPSFWPALATICMVQSWNPLTVSSGAYWNAVCWTLSCEALFYAAFPLIHRTLKVFGKKGVYGLLAGAFAFAVVFCTAKISFTSAHIPQGIPLALARLPDFVVGVCLGNIFLCRQTLSAGVNRFAWFTWSGLIGTVLLLVHVERLFVAWEILFIACLLYGLASEQSVVRSILASRVLRMGGAASYSMYLMQGPVKWLCNEAFDRIGLHSANVRFVIFLVILTLFSWLLYLFIEEPAREKIRSGFGLLQNRMEARRIAGLA